MITFSFGGGGGLCLSLYVTLHEEIMSDKNKNATTGFLKSFFI